MKSILYTIAVIFPFFGFSQSYNNPGGTINTCGGTFFDSGGAGGNYGNNENITTTLCSNAGDCISVNFTTLRLRNNDILTIYNGPNTASPVLASFTATTVAPGIFTSTTGCLTFTFTSNNAQTRNGWVAAISCGACPITSDYLQPTTGIANEFVGACHVSDCGPFTFADDGDTGADYSNSINDIYRVFCPDMAGQCMQVTFNSFVTEANFDFLLVKDGPTQNSTDIVSLDGDQSAAVPLTYTATNASGCLTFRFTSDGSIVDAGWDATLQCVPCAGGPNGTDNNDCQQMTALCSAAAITGNATGPGIVAEGCSGSACPAGGENHSSWYTFTAQTSGTLDISIAPTIASDDYDFAIYGPNVSCGSLGSPVRCTDSGLTGATGLNNTAGDNSEDVTGDSFLQTMNVVAGDSYILVVDEWSPGSGGGYTLSFGGTASLDCTILPVELSEFEAEYVPDLNVVDIYWKTESERENSHFIVQKSNNGVDFTDMHMINAVGNSTMETSYVTIDETPHIGMNYYRLKQVDNNGDENYSEVRSVNILDQVYDILSVSPNPTTNSTEVIFNSYDKEVALLKIYNGSGQLVTSKPLDCTPGGNRFEIDLSSFEKGIYLINITTNHRSYSSKLFKQ